MTIYGKVFMSGNSQAVRLPRSVRMPEGEVEIVQRGDSLILRSVRQEHTLVGAFDALCAVSDDFMPGGRVQGEPEQRDEF
jgi:antitoxin VapB